MMFSSMHFFHDKEEGIRWSEADLLRIDAFRLLTNSNVVIVIRWTIDHHEIDIFCS